MCKIFFSEHPHTATTFFTDEIVHDDPHGLNPQGLRISVDEFAQALPGRYAYRVSGKVTSTRVLEALFLDYLESIETARQGELADLFC